MGRSQVPEMALIILKMEEMNTCKCISSFSGSDRYRKIQIEKSETKFKFSLCDPEYYERPRCECALCDADDGKLFEIEIAENDIVLLMPHDFHRFFVTKQEERRLKLEKIEMVA